MTSEESEQPERQHHKEGVDRPKSRLGHKSADDKDSGSMTSSKVSIKSDKLVNSEETKASNQRDQNKSPSSPRNSNEASRQNNSMGSRSSVRSKDSVSNVEKKSTVKGNNAENDNKSDNISTTGSETKVHRIPSAGYDRHETEAKPKEVTEQANPSKTYENTENDESKNKTTSDNGGKHVTYNDNIDTKTDDEKLHAKQKEDAKDAEDGDAEKGNGRDNFQAQSTVINPSKQDSLDQSDDDMDRPKTKDPDKLEY